MFASKITGEFAYATSTSLDNGGDNLIQSVAAAKKPGSKIIVVLETGSAVTMPWLSDISSVASIRAATSRALTGSEDQTDATRPTSRSSAIWTA